MIFAFLWVIIGDLVSMHIRVLSDDYTHNSHLPYTKVQKTDKKCFKLTKKQKDKQSDLDFDGFIAEFNSNFTINYLDIFNFFIVDVIKSNYIFSTNFLRGPPLV